MEPFSNTVETSDTKVWRDGRECCERPNRPLKAEVERLPSVDVALLDEPGELALGQDRVGHAEAGVVPDVRPAQAQRLEEPAVLDVAVVVLGGAQRVRHPFDAVHDRARKVIGRVNLRTVKFIVEHTAVRVRYD